MGDPRGIGPEIILRVIREADVLSGARLMIVGSGAVLQREAANLDFEFDLPVVSGARQAAEHPAALLDLDNFPADRLTPRQAQLLEVFMRHPGQTLTREFLMRTVWNTNYMGDTRTLDVHVRWIRERIEKDPSSPRYLRTVRGVGYRFGVPDAD